MKTVLILSTGRTGTNFFANLFQSSYSDQVESHHVSAHSALINILTNMNLCHLAPRFGVVFLWRLLKAKELDKCTRPIFMDSNNLLYALPLIAPTLYPDLHVIHIVRDPRDYVRSHMNWAKHRPKSWIADRLIPFWQPNGVLCDGISPGRWMRMSKLERFSWVWSFKNRLLEKIAGSRIPYLRIRFEDVFSTTEPEPVFQRILAFMGIEGKTPGVEVFEEKRNTSTKGMPHWRDWESADCRKLAALCEPLMARYGYGLEDEWKDRLQIDRHRPLHQER